MGQDLYNLTCPCCGAVLEVDAATQTILTHQAPKPESVPEDLQDRERRSDLPYPDTTFDRTFCCAVLEHLPDPVKALKETYRVLKPGGIAGLIKTDWGDPLISPESEAVTGFFGLFEGGFNHRGAQPAAAQRSASRPNS